MMLPAQHERNRTNARAHRLCAGMCWMGRCVCEPNAPSLVVLWYWCEAHSGLNWMRCGGFRPPCAPQKLRPLSKNNLIRTFSRSKTVRGEFGCMAFFSLVMVENSSFVPGVCFCLQRVRVVTQEIFVNQILIFSPQGTWVQRNDWVWWRWANNNLKLFLNGTWNGIEILAQKLHFNCHKLCRHFLNWIHKRYKQRAVSRAMATCCPVTL